jgi:FAD/FMN-containing dehydrogenase
MRGGRVSHSPAVIVYATDSSDVQNVVKCATKLDYIVNALSGGHSYEGYGLGSMYNNIIINMEAINYININPNDRTGTFGAGARIGPIYYKLYQYGQYTINAGTCPWVGLAGHALGGGQGFLSRLYGLLSDNILEMKAINAQGKSIFYQVVKMSIYFR